MSIVPPVAQIELLSESLSTPRTPVPTITIPEKITTPNAIPDLPCSPTDPSSTLLDEETTRKLPQNLRISMAALSNNDNAKLHSSEMHLTFTYTLLRKIVLGELRANQEQQNNLYLDHNLPCGIIVETVLSPYEVIGKQNL